MSHFWAGFEKQANALTNGVKQTAQAVFRGAEKVEHAVAPAAAPHVLNYGKGGNVFVNKVKEAPHVLDYSRGGQLDQQFHAQMAKSKEPRWKLGARARQAEIDAARARVNQQRALPGRFAREEGVGVAVPK